MWIRIATIFLVTFVQTGFFSNAEALQLDNDENYHREILRALKKINSRLVILENDKMKVIQTVQESLQRQIEEIRDSLQQIQATGEFNKSEMLASLDIVKTDISDVEGHLRNEVMVAFDKQKEEQKKQKKVIISDNK